MKKVLGIVTLLAVASLVTVLYLIYSSQADAPAIYIQAAMGLLVSSLALVGCYAVQSFSPGANKLAKTAVFGLGGVMIVLGLLASFNIVDFIGTINWLISIGIVFMLLVQLQLLGWGTKGGSITKIASLLIIVSNIFLAIFFITKLDYAELEIWIHVSVLASILSFVLGMIFVPKQMPTEKPA